MLSKGIGNFIRDETGGYTIWSLIWFSLYVAMGGLAVDITDAYRTRTQLQATADAAALAGVMSLPDTADAVAQAVGYAENNMVISTNGHVLDPNDVYTGNWNTSTDQFTVDGTPLNAVYVRTSRADANQNPLATNFLRILSIWGIPLDRWNINTEAVALTFVPSCLLQNGFVAGNRLVMQSNNKTENTCYHAQNMYDDHSHQDFSVDLSNVNGFGEGTMVSMPDLADLDSRNNLCDKNDGLCDPGVLVQGDMWPQDVKELDNIIAALRAGDAPYTPSYMFDPDTGALKFAVVSGAGYNESFNGPYLADHIYDIRCSNDTKTLNLPKTNPDGTPVVLENVVIVTNCKIGAANGGTIKSGVIASSSMGPANNQDVSTNAISLAGGWNLGDDSFCTSTSGKVAMYAKASAHIAAGDTVYGLRIVVGGDLDFTANGNVYGISAQAGYDIQASTSNGTFSYCGGEFDPTLFAKTFRLVR